MTYRQNGGADHNVSVRDLAFREPDRRMTKLIALALLALGAASTR
jgi:hypothetical protein